MARRRTKSILECFADLPDPRIDRTRDHKLIDLVVIAICAVISGAEHWTEVEDYGKTKEEWLRSFLELPNGIPSHDTFGRVFSRLDADVFCECFLSWLRTLYDATNGKAIAIDGKTLRRSYDRTDGKAALHMVHAWAVESHLLLGQVACDEKSNEITAIPELLEVLDINGCLVTIDAMGCQKKIARKIKAKGAEYILGLKGNQTKLSQEVENFFACAVRDNFAVLEHDYHKTVDKGHGRVETREYFIISEQSFETQGQWGGLNAVGMVRRERCIDGVSSYETNYYICSQMMSAQAFGKAVRGHWRVENNLHWVLDVAFREDESRIRKGNGPQNFGVLRRFALSLLKQERTICKLGMKSKRKKCGWDNDYLVAILMGDKMR